MKPVFLSYSRKNVEDVQEIANILCAGGIKIWQDVESLSIGNTENQIRKAINEECAAFFFYVTEESVNSEFIRDIEIREAFRKSRNDENFQIVPLIHMPLDRANEKLKGTIRGDISRYNGAIMKEGDALLDAARKIRKILLKATIKPPADHQDYSVSLMTYSRTPGNIYPRLDLDWSRLNFPDKLISNSTWNAYLLPALLDVKDALLYAGITNIRLFTKANLATGLAFGYVFRRETGFKLDIQQAEQLWTTRTTPHQPSGFRLRSESRGIGSMHLGVNLSIATSVDKNMGSYMAGNDLSFRAELHCEPVKGPSRLSVPDGDTAAAVAWEVGNNIRELRGKYSISDIHIFAAMPLGLAYLIGSELNACGNVHLYEFDRSESKYYPSWVLEGSY